MDRSLCRGFDHSYPSVPDRAILNFKVTPTWFDFVRVATMAGWVLSAAYSFTNLTRTLRIERNDYSYGLYLYHMLIVSTLLAFGLTDRWWEWLVIPCASFAVAAASWFLVERPMLRLKDMAALKKRHRRWLAGLLADTLHLRSQEMVVAGRA
jgi:peptidoglycan/LPS O-acetylase OafA/YrhL